MSSYSYGGPPPTHLVWGILTTLFCCLPFGVVSIVYAAQVESKWQAGDQQGAYDYSRRAKNWAIWSAVSVLAVGVLALLAHAGGGSGS
ncbi:CD225/dispanin family protein [Actinomadura barringtoniae]|uniref:CD225/dispanin family protein n=1 Tax=Actinomadura barringtoniae TaxID=1427535 RepID=A0A939T7E2_9ACTN|nr:CD225/dispanin family protein [Actinomadura barringtoniae]MBO2449212.1 CD225/dispanin family protein [Actinomadura barringtoniae]